MSTTDWICIHKTTKLFEAEAIKGNLLNANINCVLLNKQDSSYLAFGYIELHVPIEQKQAALLIIEGAIEPN